MKKKAKTVTVVYKSTMAARKDKMPSRNASRDRDVSKQVVDSLNALDLRMPFLRRNRWPPVTLTPAMCPVYLGFLLSNMTRLG